MSIGNKNCETKVNLLSFFFFLFLTNHESILVPYLINPFKYHTYRGLNLKPPPCQRREVSLSNKAIGNLSGHNERWVYFFFRNGLYIVDHGNHFFFFGSFSQVIVRDSNGWF